MMSKLSLRSHARLTLAVAGSLALASTAWAQAVHKAEVAGAAASPAQIESGKKVFEVACLAPSRHSPAPITCSATGTAPWGWS